MIDDIDLAALLKRLRSRVKEHPEVLKDALTLIGDACLADEGPQSDALQISRTILEIAYPERVGPILMITCVGCGKQIYSEEERACGNCIDCKITTQGEEP